MFLSGIFSRQYLCLDCGHWFLSNGNGHHRSILFAHLHYYNSFMPTSGSYIVYKSLPYNWHIYLQNRGTYVVCVLKQTAFLSYPEALFHALLLRLRYYRFTAYIVRFLVSETLWFYHYTMICNDFMKICMLIETAILRIEELTFSEKAMIRTLAFIPLAVIFSISNLHSMAFMTFLSFFFFFLCEYVLFFLMLLQFLYIHHIPPFCILTFTLPSLYFTVFQFTTVSFHH